MKRQGAAYYATIGDGFVCELGVYKGQGQPLNEIAKHFSPNKVYGFDTFAGLPDFWCDGFFKIVLDVSQEQLDFEPDCVPYRGLLEETLPKFLQNVQAPADLIHINCNFYSSTHSALRIIAPRIRSSTVLVRRIFQLSGLARARAQSISRVCRKHELQSQMSRI